VPIHSFRPWLHWCECRKGQSVLTMALVVEFHCQPIARIGCCEAPQPLSSALRNDRLLLGSKESCRRGPGPAFWERDTIQPLSQLSLSAVDIGGQRANLGCQSFDRGEGPGKLVDEGQRQTGSGDEAAPSIDRDDHIVDG
jgi:hypothetical protein